MFFLNKQKKIVIFGHDKKLFKWKYLKDFKWNFIKKQQQKELNLGKESFQEWNCYGKAWPTNPIHPQGKSDVPYQPPPLHVCLEKM